MVLSEISKYLCASSAATSAMTLFSYGLSSGLKRNYKEPELLATIIGEALSQRSSRASGWAAHYTMGGVWAALYALSEAGKPSQSAMAGDAGRLGLVTGMASVAAWRTMFRFYAKENRQRYDYLFHLIPAHLVYAAVLMLCLKKCQVRICSRLTEGREI
ncbi:hypothetical protein [Dyadobacter sandarakinus]|uniref:Uncharacterized protein n=1 Tax=Dyadobacter sandarakinus TaxID=2747268 RepID=A0ABX7I2K6_9BACT|nr:hypothetical protein [Dyadobacter sandarakinus]QRR00304.1 hypothetical protein HWI92_04985 [Dyadobacter sandarakinus]